MLLKMRMLICGLGLMLAVILTGASMMHVSAEEMAGESQGESQGERQGERGGHGPGGGGMQMEADEEVQAVLDEASGKFR